MNSQGGKRISDQVSDNIVASMLGVQGLPQSGDSAVARAVADAFRQPRDQNVNCLVREVVNGTLRASRFTHLSMAEAARATMVGVIQGARQAGLDLRPIISLASERILWSTAAVGEALPASARGAVEGVAQGTKRWPNQRSAVLELVVSSLLRAVQDIDERQVSETRCEIAEVVDQA